MVRRTAVLVICALALALCLQCAQAKVYTAKDFSTVLVGKVVPLSMKLKSLDASWRKFSMGAGRDYYSMWDPFGATGYTRGDVIVVGGETFLVSYRPPEDRAYQRAVNRGGPVQAQSAPLTPDTPVVLNLVNLRTLPGVTPMAPFNLKTELADYEKATKEIAAARQAEMEMYNRGAGGESNLSTLAIAIQMYAEDYEALPPLTSMDAAKAALSEYVPSEEAFTDPMTGGPYGVNSSLSGKRTSEISGPATAVVFYQTQPGPNGMREVAYADGHTQGVSEADWAKVKEQNGITE